MRRILGITVLLLALTACGDDDGNGGGRADDPASTTPSESETGQPADAEVVDILSGSAAGGEVAAEATLLEDDAALQRYLRQFESAAFAADLTAAVREHQPADDGVVGMAVIEISCDEPPSASVVEDDGAYVVTPGKVVTPHQECVVPVTSVAVVVVGAAG